MEDSCFLSNYVDVVPYQGEYAIYNKINGALVLLPDKYVEKSNCGRWLFDSSDTYTAQYLKENLFFISDKNVQSMILNANSFEEDYDNVTLVISTTECCNCACAYCYQLNWPHSGSLSEKEYRKWILTYIKYVVSKAHEGAHLTIKYFGGEPLLKIDLIIAINCEIRAIIASAGKNINVHYEMDTNCTLLTRKILTQFSNLSIATTLSMPNDHNHLRSGSFQVVIDNILKLSDLFELPEYQLNIGYNAHHENISEFSRFLDYMKSSQINCKIYVSNVVNYGAGSFVNHLSDEDFEKYYCENMIPSLLEHGYPVDILPHYGVRRKCIGMNPLNRKFFSNGTQALCSYFQKKTKRESGDYPSLVKSHIYLDALPEMCLKCYDFPYCGGMRPCIQCNGSYPLKSVMQNRIRLYLNSQKEL